MSSIVDDERASQTLRSFLIMSVCFAMNLGCVTTVIAYASSDFRDIGNYSNGTLFGAYCLCALFFGNVVVTYLGYKKALTVGMIQYCIYLCMYMVATFIGPGTVTKGIVLLGAAVGGTASGYLWTAQGAYFGQSAERYARFSGITKEAATGKLSSYFATIFLLFEVCLKVGAAALQLFGGDSAVKVMYVGFFGIGCLSAYGMTRIDDIASETKEISCDMVQHKASAAFRLLLTRPEMGLLVPFQVTFGFASSFINSYVSGNVTGKVLDSGSIGFFAGTIAGVACLISFLGGLWIKKTGTKWPMMLLGLCSFAGMAGGFLFYESQEVGGVVTYPGIGVGTLFMIYSLMGIGRGVFESTNKAVIADFFSGSEQMAAFANGIWTGGGSSALAYFVFPGMGVSEQVWTVVITAFLGIVCYFLAAAINASGRFKNIQSDVGDYQALPDDNGSSSA